MYQTYPSLILGFHGCDKSVGKQLLNGDLPFRSSDKSYDWLGRGMYFWENAPTRALHYAQEKKDNPEMGHVDEPFVVGAVIDLGRCLNLLDHQNLMLLQQNYAILERLMDKQGKEMPQNKQPTSGMGGADLVLRYLDRAVIEFTHKTASKDDVLKGFDSTRAVYVEGSNLYPGAGFNEKNHIQISIRNPNCIKGFFLPRQMDAQHRPI
ncbi:MAG: hypothetical protein OET90_10460 [Desulfuromonadales bacterium]|nr:hypothetical protein [Desulfuromonadales bacterium]